MGAPNSTSLRRKCKHETRRSCYHHNFFSSSMARDSARSRRIRFLFRMLERLIPVWMDGDLDDEDYYNILTIIVYLIVQLHSIMKRRYLATRSHRKSPFDPFSRDWSGTGTLCTNSPFLHLSDGEFLQKYRVQRPSFKKLLSKIKNHDVFKRGKRGPEMAPASHQLMVFLYRIGIEGSGASASNLRSVFGIAKGTADQFCRRCCDAILSLRSEYIHWPDEKERAFISRSIQRAYNLPNCVGIIDGTLLPLARKPQREDFPDYSGRKFAYSLSTLVVADDRRRIRYHLSGFPGTAHDNRIFQATMFYESPDEYFSKAEYLLGDSAFECKPFMVSSFRNYASKPMTPVQTRFNAVMAGPRSISEHTIGIWKARFPFLRKIPNNITSSDASHEAILKLIEASIVLHNFLISENDEIPEEWVADNEEDEYESPISDMDEVNQPVGDLPGTTRRSQLAAYVDEFM